MRLNRVAGPGPEVLVVLSLSMEQYEAIEWGLREREREKIMVMSKLCDLGQVL